MDALSNPFRKFKVSICAALFATAALFASSEASGQLTVLIATNSVWDYLDDGSNQGLAWRDPSFLIDDEAWSAGPGDLGYGNPGQATLVGYGSNPTNKYITTYFKQVFYLTEAASVTNLMGRLRREGGAVIYVNGVEVFRSGLPDSEIDYLTLANAPLLGEEDAFLVDPSLLFDGYNLVAAEVHLSEPNSPAMEFALELVAGGEPAQPSPLQLTRGPYLQTGTPSSIIVRWRTSVPTNSIVRYGTQPDNLRFLVDDLEAATEHIFPLTNLRPGTKYFYLIGADGTNLAEGHEFFFITAPASPKPTRIWAIGDSGTTGTGLGKAVAVRNAYEAFTGARHTDVWLMLGDNAYNSGTDLEYQRAVFDVYTNELRSTVLWSTIGNHDSDQDPNPALTLPYFVNFTFPKHGEAGGLASGTENYYSFDYGNIHFICLDAMTATSRLRGSAMLNWLENDLAANTNLWLVAFWHHPPYTKGSHNSDTEIELIQMRTNAVPILESYGVDLVLCGHSHNYERSYLLNGHYGKSITLTPSMLTDAGTGRPSETGAYLKTTTGPAAGKGTVYAVAGSSGWATFRVGYHPAMFISELETGSLVIDIEGNRLDAKFLRETGAIDDSFTIIKGAPPEPFRLATFSLAADGVRARCKSVAGHTYQLEWTPTLEAAQWTPVSGPITATGATTSWSDSPPTGSPRGFYRVLEISQ